MVVRVDLEDFFISIGGARVLALFRTLGYPDGAARVLTGLCTNSAPRVMLSPKDPSKYDFELPRPDWLTRKRYEAPHLPQGAPTSPALANLCAFNFDIRLKAAAEVAGARYTRYADDLTFSGGKRFARGVHRFVALVGAIALEEGFSVNFRKTRAMRRSARQRVTGIVVNEKVNVARENYDRLKATLYNSAVLGPASQNRAAHRDYRAHLAGRVAHVAALNAQRARRLQELFDRIAWSDPDIS